MNQTRRWTVRLAIALLVLAAPASARALEARALLDRMRTLDDTTRHWTDRSQTMSLVTQLKSSERHRDIRTYNRRYPAGENKSVSFFTAPPEVRGVAFLQWSHDSVDDEQWLFLPEIRRTRRIAAQDRDQSFMGTAFSYRDLDVIGKISTWTEREAPSVLLRDDVLEGRSCHVIELSPAPELAGYRRLVVWLDQAQLVVRKLELFGAGDEATKILTLGELRDVGPVPTAHRLEMRNVRDGTRTIVTVSDVRYDSALEDDLFTQPTMERGDPTGGG